jgi:hypothetical protein
MTWVVQRFPRCQRSGEGITLLARIEPPENSCEECGLPAVSICMDARSRMTHPPIVWRIEFDEALADTKVIAEAWDAAGLYQIGYFPGMRWGEWNGRYRFTGSVNDRGLPDIAWHGCALGKPGWHDSSSRVLSHTMGGGGNEPDLSTPPRDITIVEHRPVLRLDLPGRALESVREI